ncbi:GntR family transcriptional regulator [Paracoccus sp. (in: a-proteobacteria)]|uniref:GntR family transcriptional regulator n=1 Tax=Paracoccus sp. TaxID=267 RepID=UPI0035B264A8
MTKPEENDRTFPAGIAARLRREILTGELPPGSPLKERDNAQRLGVSRTPLREAVRILGQEGLVTLRPLRSPVIADPSLEEVLDEIAVLRQLELFSGGLACQNATTEEIEEITAMVAEIAAQYATGDKVDVFDLDMRMHTALVDAAHNAALSRTYREYLARLWRIRFLSARERGDGPRVLADHQDIVAALRDRDAARTTTAIALHLDGLIRNITRHFQSRAARPPAP